MRCMISICAAVLAVAGCATVPSDDVPNSQKVYRTGSNLPVRDPGASTRVQTADQDAMLDAMRKKTGKPGGVGPGQ